MAEIAYALVWQSGSISVRSRGREFPRGKQVRISNPDDIKYFKADGQFNVLERSVERHKAAAPKADNAESDKKAEKKKSAKAKKSGKKSGKK